MTVSDVPAQRHLNKTGDSVPFFDLSRQTRALHGDMTEAWEGVLAGGQFVSGAEVEEFERRFARLCDVQYCVGLSSGTAALRLALLALGISNGKRVLTSPNTFVATVEAILQVGGTPVFVDIDEETGTMDPAEVARLAPTVDAIIPVHLHGQPADMDAILKTAATYGLKVIEDACQAHGASVLGRPTGSLGDAAAFSFYPGKNLGAVGDAGAVTTNDPDVARKLRMLRDHGQQRKHVHELVGSTERMASIQAAILLVKLNYLPGWNARRRQLAARYVERLADLPVKVPKGTPYAQPSFHLFAIRTPDRDSLRTSLRRSGVDTAIHYPTPVHLQRAYRFLNNSQGEFPQAERWCRETLSLPMFPELRDDEVDRVSESIAAFVGAS